MNQPESSSKLTPKQALSPTPALYAELVGDGMEQLAAASMSCIGPLPPGALLHDVGCGLGAATAAASAIANASEVSIGIKGTDINNDALDVYRRTAAEQNWPAEGLRMDAAALEFPGQTFSHAIGNALLFVLPNDGIGAVKEIHRTLKPGGVAVVNSWAYAAAKRTRPAGTPLPRQGLEKWERAEFVKEVVVKGGFSADNVTLTQRSVYVTVGDVRHFATMLWSFIGGTSSAGWLESDEENWARAVGIVAEELEKTDEYERLDEQHSKFKFVANIAVAVKQE
ncbi:S-adenosyl-L-methionine-dependent methyltransferase [Thelonectria olida]|uniref:S-adenosyl-L-methionine-dependent methyltransferase n=1 Tax=Thelonectria olida TaxID=1576542 RepID=A0A9P8W9I1_9HYPO|nr:S-adenosyl-L-methionine-dependent methyltransferase [Thelonectria olida]